MNNKHITHTTEINDNIFADLGFNSTEAKILLENNQKIIAFKYQLMEYLDMWIKKNNLTQLKASKILGITRPRVSDLINKKSDKFTIDTLLHLNIRSGNKLRLNLDIKN